MPRPGTSPKFETTKQFAERIAKQMREQAARMKEDAKKLENAASVMDGKK